MHRQQSFLTAGLVAAACGCSLVIGDIPPAANKGGRESAMGGQAGASGFGGEGSTGGQGDTTDTTGRGGGVIVGGGGEAGAAVTVGTTQSGNTTSNEAGGAGAPPGGGGTGGSTGFGGNMTCVDTCDCDGDGSLSEACAGDDCDDDDALVYPDQTRFFAMSRGSAGFDYNCDGQSERQFQQATQCSALLVCSEGASDGFLGTLPACGTSGLWGRCKLDGLLCVDEVIENARTMLCR